MSIRVLVLDFDDTLLATFKCRSLALIEAAKDFGYYITDNHLKSVWGLPFEEMISTLLPNVNYINFYKHYKQVMYRHTPELHSGAKDLLDHLEDGSLPHRPEGAKKSGLCKYCEYKTRCWDGEDKETP